MAEQLEPQPPQFRGSLVVSTQVEPQRVRPPPHWSVQRPALASQSGNVAGQRTPQYPQDSGSVRSVSQPSLAPRQSAKPGMHSVGGIRQRPAQQLTLAAPGRTFGRVVQSMSQEPQCATSVARFVHSPPQRSRQPASRGPPSTSGAVLQSCREAQPWSAPAHRAASALARSQPAAASRRVRRPPRGRTRRRRPREGRDRA
jgi:hypothetical protein